jgi:hypothetical protein
LNRPFESALDPIRKILKKLEEGGLLASFLEGKTRAFQWNPHYPFLKEIQSVTKKAYACLPASILEDLFQKKKRKRPRKSGKPL